MPRPQGSLNKVTKETRDALECPAGHLSNVNSALEELREKDPNCCYSQQLQPFFHTSRQD